MKVAIFYHSLNPGAKRHAILGEDGTRLGFIRGVVVEADDLESALDVAQPQPDESVMNTHEIPKSVV